MTTFTRGMRLGDFEIIRELGRGSMGVVYEARQLNLERKVALKVLPIAVQRRKSSAIARFHTEARAVGRLTHPNIVPVYASGEAQGVCYYAMEFVDGLDLKAAIADKPLPPEQVARVGRDVASALHAAHQAGVVHRDIKPANILLDKDGRARVTDFGLAKVADDPKITMAGHVVGSPAYMSPEQATGADDQIDAQSDIFCLGITLYQAASRAMPFTGHNLEELFEEICLHDPPSLKKLNKRLPSDLITIIETCLRKRKSQRYPNAFELAGDCNAFIEGKPIKARPPRIHERVFGWVGRNRILSAALLFFLFTIGIGVTVRVLGDLRTAREVGELHATLEGQHAAGQIQEALATCQAILALDPGNATALTLLGRLEAEREQQLDAELAAHLASEAQGPLRAGQEALAAALRLERDLGVVRQALVDALSAAAADFSGSLQSVRDDATAAQEELAADLERSLQARAREAESHFNRAFSLLGTDAALIRDMGRVRILLAAAAERAGQDDTAARLLREVTFLFNPDGVHDALLTPTGTFTLRTDQPAQVRLLPLAEDPEGVGLVAGEPALEGPTPLGPVALHPGSYRLELRFVGGTLEMPLAVRRARQVDLSLRLLRDEQIPAGFRYVPGVRAILGGDPLASRALPRIELDVPGFLIAEREVSLAEFCAFLAASSEAQRFNLTRSLRDAISGWQPNSEPLGRRPVWDLAWFWARKYCEWRSEVGDLPRPVRLPTEIEWELAARGLDGRPFPWGFGLAPDRADLGLVRAAPGLPADPDEHPGDRSPFGLRATCGGVAEWTASCHPKNGQLAVLRGGSFRFQTEPPRLARRSFHVTDQPVLGAGLRLVMALPEAE